MFKILTNVSHLRDKSIYRCRNLVATLVTPVMLLLFSASPSNAEFCDLKNLKFGITQEKLKADFKLDALDVATTGEGIIRVPGRKICEDLPEKSMAELVLLDNNFVQLGVFNENTSGELLAFAVKTFDKQDNTKKPKSPKTALWNKKNKYSVMYNTYTEGRHKLERITITSSNHQSAFDKQNTAEDEAIEEEDRQKTKVKGKSK